MRSQRLVKVPTGVLTLGMVVLAVMWTTSSRVQARAFPEDDDEEALVRIGFKITPVSLNLRSKDRELVGLGSYLVNGAGDCNGCHTAGGPPNFNYAPGGNPYVGQPTVVDPTTYMAGGTDFGPGLPPGFYDPGYGNYLGPKSFLEVVRAVVHTNHNSESQPPNLTVRMCLLPRIRLDRSPLAGVAYPAQIQVSRRSYSSNAKE